MSTASPRRITIVWWCFVGALLLSLGALLGPLHPPDQVGWRPLVWDWGHVPLFAIPAFLLATGLFLSGRSTVHAVLRTLILLGLIAGWTEFMQKGLRRNPDMLDLGRDLQGIAIGIALAVAVRLWRSRRSREAFVWAGAGGAMLLLSLHPVISYVAVMVKHERQFPLLEDFESGGSVKFWALEKDGKEAKPVRAAEVDPESGRANHWLLFTVEEDAWVSLHHDAQGRDWRGAARLVFDYQFDAQAPRILGVRIDNLREPKRRLSLEARLFPGISEAQVDIPADADSQEILAAVGTLVFFFADEPAGGVFALDKVRLEMGE